MSAVVMQPKKMGIDSFEKQPVEELRVWLIEIVDRLPVQCGARADPSVGCDEIGGFRFAGRVGVYCALEFSKKCEKACERNLFFSGIG
jgi:hypothetical protein